MTTEPSITLTTSLDVPFLEAFAYLAEPKNQAEWAVHFVKSVRVDAGVTLATTPMGEVPLRINAVRELGIVDIRFGEGPAIPARLVRNGPGCDYIFTLSKPAAMPEAAWTHEAIPHLREELALLKKCLESRAK